MAVNEEIFLGSGASLTLVPETDLYFKLNESTSNTTNIVAVSDFSNNYLLVEDIYVGCVVDLYDADVSTTVPSSSHIITQNDSTSITISPPHTISTLASGDFVIIRGYGAPNVGQKNSTVKRLNADNWLGLVESATFPNVEVEMKQMNLQLGGSRNFTHQYKGIETASGANINLVSNHGAFLYYALGSCSQVQCHVNATNPNTNGVDADSAGDVYIDVGGGAGGSITTTTHLSQGPIFYKTGYAATGTQGDGLTPPLVANLDDRTAMYRLTRPTTTATALTHPITYTFTEADSGKLPSFALEQTLSKLESSNTYITGDTSADTESHSFVRIARGNRINTFTMTANENEEVKMTMDLNTRAVHKLKTNESYEAKGGSGTDNSKLFNFNDTSDDAEFLEPFFFSSGHFKVFGQQFLKVTNLTLTINNNLQDKRFIGVGNKSIKDALPAQRTYEVSFTALVTDNQLFEELLNQTEVGDTASTLLTLQFDKANGEQILMKFQDYFLNSANFTIPDDKGPITVEGTVMPRTLNSCTVKTHWVLQG